VTGWQIALLIYALLGLLVFIWDLVLMHFEWDKDWTVLKSKAWIIPFLACLIFWPAGVYSLIRDTKEQRRYRK